MPVPLTTAMLLAAFVLVVANDRVLEIVAVVMVVLGVLNQALIVFAPDPPPGEEL